MYLLYIIIIIIIIINHTYMYTICKYKYIQIYKSKHIWTYNWLATSCHVCNAGLN